MRSRTLLTLALLATMSHSARAADQAARARRPGNEPWSDGPTLAVKAGYGEGKRKSAANLLSKALLRLRALEWGQGRSIPIVDDMLNFLRGSNGRPGYVHELWEKRAQLRGHVAASRRQLHRDADASRGRLTHALADAGFVGQDRLRLAELLVWRNLAYNSSTLAHGSVAPGGAEDEATEARARAGLENAVLASFRLSRRLEEAVAHNDPSRFLHLSDTIDIHGAELAAFPEKEPGKFRRTNFTWPRNSFGVDWWRIHGSNGEAAQFQRMLEQPRGKVRPLDWFRRRPLNFSARALYWIHNVHPYRDGNGRNEVLMSWPLARAAGFPLPPQYDSASGAFKAAATKWGGTPLDLHDLLARGALASERFFHTLRPLIAGTRFVSLHTQKGLVAGVVANRGGRNERSLLVMFPVTHAADPDPELTDEAKAGRLTMTGGSFDPGQITIEYAINGRHNTWQRVRPQAVQSWDARYPWWSTAEPIFKIELPYGYDYINLRIQDPGGQPLGAPDYYLKITGQRDLMAELEH
jgi:hypothetical protein